MLDREKVMQDIYNDYLLVKELLDKSNFFYLDQQTKNTLLYQET